MKKLFIFILPILLYSSEIKFSKTFTKVFLNDILTSEIHLNVSSKSADDFDGILEKYNSLLEEDLIIHSEILKNNTIPIYNNTDIVRFDSTVIFKIDTLSASNLHDFFKIVKDSKNEDSLKLSFKNIKWTNSVILENKIQDNLKTNSIAWISNYANTLSLKLNKVCKVKNIDLKNNKIPNVIVNNNIAKNKSNDSRKIYANYTMECL